MAFLYIKIALALLLVKVHVLVFFIRRRHEVTMTLSGTGNGALRNRFRKLCFLIGDFFLRLHQGMHHYESFRKFYIYLVIVVLTLLQFIDLQASTDIARYVLQHHLDGGAAVTFYRQYGGFLTTPWATAACFFSIFILFYYRWADKVLLFLHGGRRRFCFTGMLALVIIFTSARCFIVGESIYVLMLASYFYPEMTEPDAPKSRRPVTILSTIRKLAA